MKDLKDATLAELLRLGAEFIDADLRAARNNRAREEDSVGFKTPPSHRQPAAKPATEVDWHEEGGVLIIEFRE